MVSIISLGAALGSVGCAGSVGAGQAKRPDVRGSVAVTDPAPRLLLVGPARLLHVDADRRRPVMVYRVPRREGTVADCKTDTVPTEAIVALGHAVVDVPWGESLCVAGQRRVTVSWHAQRLPEAIPLAQEVLQLSLR